MDGNELPTQWAAAAPASLRGCRHDRTGLQRVAPAGKATQALATTWTAATPDLTATWRSCDRRRLHYTDDDRRCRVGALREAMPIQT